MDTRNQKVQLFLTEEYIARLNQLKRRVGARSYADAIYFAVDIINQIGDEMGKGSNLCFKTPEGICRIIVPFLGRFEPRE